MYVPQFLILILRKELSIRHERKASTDEFCRHGTCKLLYSASGVGAGSFPKSKTLTKGVFEVMKKDCW